jgi:surfeit locus 1 family protein
MAQTGIRFRPPWWGVLLAAAGCAGGIALGQWQTGRAEEKRAAAGAPLVELRGRFEAERTVLLDNKLRRGRPGYEVVTALRAAGDGIILVNRGWVAAGRSRSDLPAIRTPSGEVRLKGVRREHFARAYEPAGAKVEGTAWANVTPQRFALWSGLSVEPWVFEQHSELDDGLVREWPPADAGAERNEAYALQWYSLAALSLILLFVLNFKIGKPKS